LCDCLTTREDGGHQRSRAVRIARINEPHLVLLHDFADTASLARYDRDMEITQTTVGRGSVGSVHVFQPSYRKLSGLGIQSVSLFGLSKQGGK
jgi:hypothetical protein